MCDFNMCFVQELGVSDFNHQMAILLAVDELLDRKMAEVSASVLNNRTSFAVANKCRMMQT